MKNIYVKELDVWTHDNEINIIKLNKWIETSASKDVKLIFPKKEYYFKELYNENAFLNLDNVHNLVIDGQGSTFVFGEVGHYLKINNCSQILMKNIKLDWDWDTYPLSSLGIVEKVEKDGLYIDIKFPKLDQVEADMNIEMVGPLDPKTYAPGTTRGVEFRPFTNPHIPDYIRKSGSEKLKQMIRELEKRFKGFEVIDNNIIRFYMEEPKWTNEWIRTGQAYNFRHYEYNTVGVLVETSESIFFENITMYSCPGSGYVIRNDVKKFGFDSCKIILKPGTSRTITTTADGIHIANTQGDFYIRNCIFSRSGDDCINFHDNTLMGFEIVEEDTICFKGFDISSTPIKVGDELEFRNLDLSPSNITKRVKSVRLNENTHTCLVAFESKINNSIKENMIVWNKRFSTGNFHIHDNIFYENRARAILVHGSNGIIENNHFFKIQGAAIQVETGAEIRWAEGMGVRNVIIRNNHFQSCDLNGWTMATIYIGVYLPNGRTAYPIFKNITINDNTFIDGQRQAIFISSSENVKVFGNSISNYMQRDLKEHSYGSSQIEAPMYLEGYNGLIQHVLSKEVDISYLS